MFKLNRKIEYALIALKHMVGKRPGELTSAKEIAETYHGSFDVVARVMQIMAQKGLLRAEQGAQGGYQILKDLSKVSLYDLGLMLMGPVKLVKCIDGQEPCGIEKSCNIMAPINSLNLQVEEFYRSLSLLDIIHRNPKSKNSSVPEVRA